MQLENAVAQASETVERIVNELAQVVVGQTELIRRLLMAIFADGHVLIEGLPGLAKTTTIKSLGQVVDLTFKRVQFTPDLLPADVTGTQVYSPKSGEFTVRKGPVFTNLLLADEINRAPAKVQSALLEAMQERQVTIASETFALDDPFLVMATQNPIEQEGTYALPEAQVDRFLLKLKITYTSADDEQLIMERVASGQRFELNKVATADELLAIRKLSYQMHVVNKVRRYIVDLVSASRQPSAFKLKELQPYIAFGASPRASINLEKTAKINALFDGRTYITPQDVKDVAYDVLRHRILLSYEAEAEGKDADAIIKQLLDTVDVP